MLTLRGASCLTASPDELADVLVLVLVDDGCTAGVSVQLRTLHRQRRQALTVHQEGHTVWYRRGGGVLPGTALHTPPAAAAGSDGIGTKSKNNVQTKSSVRDCMNIPLTKKSPLMPNT